ncbi:uncharacterized protein LOC134299367 isoform X2 [Anolis carolinensis]|uniref:uncharacterized protein LOC134299367 isoform X2 n=1 Tax=Anolis carolinensis TaxID=28377 RepID=UPI002F2B41C5
MEPKKTSVAKGGEKKPARRLTILKPKEAKADKPKEAIADKPKKAKADKPQEAKEDKPQEAKEDKPKEAKDNEPKDATDATDAKAGKPKDAIDKKSNFQQQIQKVKTFIKSPSGYRVCALITLMVYIISFIFLILAYIDWKQSASLRGSMQQIRNFMITKDSSNQFKDDPVIIFEAEKSVQELATLSTMINELNEAIEEIRDQLSHGWVASVDAIYLFDPLIATWYEARTYCKKENAELAWVESAKDERFIEEELRGKDKSHWLGVQNSGAGYRWDVGNISVSQYYWAPYQPAARTSSRERAICVTVRAKCQTHFRCWQTYYCDTLAKVLCKRKPNPKWMT